MSDSSHLELIASGTLLKSPFAHLLVYLEQHQLSGTLAVWPEEESERDRGQDRILFRRGSPIAVRLLESADSIEESMYPLFIRKHAPYAFYKGDLLGPKTGRLETKVDSYALIAQSLRKSARDDIVDLVLQQLKTAKLRMQPDVNLDRYKLASKEKALIELLLAEPADVFSLVKGSGLEPHFGRRIVYLLMITNAVTIYNETNLSIPPSQAAPSHRKRTISDIGFGLSRTSIRSKPNSDPVQEDSSVQRPSGTMVTETKQPADPVEKEGTSQEGVGMKRKERVSRVSRISRISSHDVLMQSVSPAPLGLDDETRQRWEEIRELAKQIDKLNYYEMLGVERKTPPDEVRDAFFGLAKKWHPDRLPEALLELKPQVDTIFGYLSQAHQCLTNEQEREKYLRSVKEGGGTPATDRLMQRVLDGAMAYQRVEVLARKHEYDRALQLLRRVLEMSDGEADYHAMLAWLLYNKHKGKDAPFTEMINATDQALRLNANHEQSNYYRALILKRMGKNHEALKYFKKVSDINPNNLDALREVRLATIRKGDKVDSQKGLFSSLFKKK